MNKLREYLLKLEEDSIIYDYDASRVIDLITDKLDELEEVDSNES